MTLAVRLPGAAGPARLFGFLALALSAALIFSRPAEAIVINIDPGNVGDSFIDRSFNLDDFDGRSADGITPWSERPERVRKGLVARVVPPDVSSLSILVDPTDLR